MVLAADVRAVVCISMLFTASLNPLWFEQVFVIMHTLLKRYFLSSLPCPASVLYS